jgi:3-oxoacyl-[acyl-carrier protein] reductase
MSMAKTALITGSGQNIGKSTALALARAGFDIILNGSRQREPLEDLQNQITAMGQEAYIAMADIGDAEAVTAMIDQIMTHKGGVDVLVNNAAIRPQAGFLDMPDADWERVMDVNYRAALTLCRAFLPGMVAKDWGRIINFSGMNSQRGYPGSSAVAVSKHAVWGLTKALAMEFGANGITSNIISPGIFPPENLSERDQPTQDRFAALAEANPTKALGQPDHIAEMIVYLVSDTGGYVNGQMLQINGGAVNQF